MPQWTIDQTTAITNRGGALLVSAAAGSGKTAVLVERVLHWLTDMECPINIDQLLLVTFTQAAAAEMRGRISAALRDAIAKNPQDTRLRRQLFLIHRAKITTVHSLCLSLIREQAVKLGVAPDFRLMDEEEGELLRLAVLEDVLEEAYAQGDEEFLALCELLNGGRDDSKLSYVILETWEKIQAHPDPIAFLEQIKQSLLAEGMDTPHGKVLLEQATLAVEYGIGFLKMALDKMAGIDELYDTYLPTFTSDLNQAERLLDALRGGDWDSALEAARAVSPQRLKAARKFEDKDLLEELKALREEWKTVAKTICEKWLTITSTEASKDRALTAPALSALIAIVKAFDQAFSAAKRGKNIADFGDLEHFAIRLLYENGEPSALAKALSENYVEIAVDEYQDTNAVQDAIFRALSKDQSNLFFVGDVKQSIYGFRLADPSIFLKKYHSFIDAEQAKNNQPRRVILGENFRSRAVVLESCNQLFSAVMGKMVGDIIYTEREALHPGADFPESGHPRYKTEVLLLDTAMLEAEDDDKTVLEARLVAQRIQTLLEEGFPIADKETQQLRPVAPGDIVILMRSPGAKAKIYLTELERIGIPAAAGERGGLLCTVEVGVIVSLLSVIDNPRQDVDLIGVMRSPLFGFAEQELAEIRLVNPDVSFYDALQQAQESFEKVENFLQRFMFWRDFACDQPVYRLIWQIYEETNALGLYGALPNGTQRQSNLLTFFERARVFESQNAQGLFSFVRFLRGIQETGNDFPSAGAESVENAVRIMSIHKSKGLEFPIVIVADCAKTFNEMDLREPILMHQDLGFGSKCRDMERGIQYDTTERMAVSVVQRKEMVSEELRILYVALTRAKEKLILTAASGTLTSSLKKWAQLASLDSLPQYAMGAVRSPLAWIITPLLSSPCMRKLREIYDLYVPERANADNNTFTVRVLLPEDLREPTSIEPISFTEPDTTGYVVQPDLSYPCACLTELPSKLTATGIGRGYRAAEAAEETPPPRHEITLRAPLFAKLNQPLTPAEVGTAHHLFMQFCDFSAAHTREGIRDEIIRLAKNNILTDEQASSVDILKIERFFASDLYQSVIAPNPIRREFKFSVLAPAQKYFPEAACAPEETILLQGVIDCLIETPDGLIILDFKTDRISEKSISKRAERYRNQMNAYTFAAEEIFSRPVLRRILYFFSIGQAWTIADDNQ